MVAVTRSVQTVLRLTWILIYLSGFIVCEGIFVQFVVSLAVGDISATVLPWSLQISHCCELCLVHVRRQLVSARVSIEVALFGQSISFWRGSLTDSRN